MSKPPEQYGKEEAQRRTEAALRAAFGTPHKTYEESKIGKRKSRGRKSPTKRRAVKKS